MKKLLLILLLIPTLALSQVSSWRGGSLSGNSTPRVQSPVDNNGMSMWRNSSPREFNRPPQYKPGSNIIVRDPWGWNDWGWGWNRWGMWGAPMFGFNYWNPIWYYNDWGYRQPGRVYVYQDGRKDTIKGKKPIINFGIQKSTDKQIGGFFAIGNKAYFITEYNTTYEKDNSTFFPFGRRQDVDFPLVDDYIKLQTLYVGVGKRFKRTGIHFMIGSVSERVRWRGKDNIGYITFPKYHNRFMSVKVGAIHDLKNVTLKLDHDPIIRNTTFGLGLNF